MLILPTTSTNHSPSFWELATSDAGRATLWFPVRQLVNGRLKVRVVLPLTRTADDVVLKEAFGLGKLPDMKVAATI